MTLYRTVLPPVDSQFYGTGSYTPTGKYRPSGLYTPVEEAIEMIREVAYPELQKDGTVVVIFEADDEYELAETVKDLESELNAMQYWQHLTIERPMEVPS